MPRGKPESRSFWSFVKKILELLLTLTPEQRAAVMEAVGDVIGRGEEAARTVVGPPRGKPGRKPRSAPAASAVPASGNPPDDADAGEAEQTARDVAARIAAKKGARRR